MKIEEIEKQNQIMEKINNLNNCKTSHYYILTMGCKLNENDSEKLAGMLEKMGYTKTEEIRRSRSRFN